MGLTPGKSTVNFLTRRFALEAMSTLLPRSKYFLENGYIFQDDFQIVRQDGFEVNDPLVKQFQEVLDHLQSLTSV